MRLPIIAAAAFAATAPLPALAQEVDTSRLADAVEAMDDPAMQEQVSLMAAALVGVLLEMPVGPLMEAASEAAGEDAPAVDPNATVRDLMGPQAAEAPEIVAERLPEMMGAAASMAGAMGGALEAMLPHLRDMADRLPRDLPKRR